MNKKEIAKIQNGEVKDIKCKCGKVMKEFGSEIDYCWCPDCGTFGILYRDKFEWFIPKYLKDVNNG